MTDFPSPDELRRMMPPRQQEPPSPQPTSAPREVHPHDRQPGERYEDFLQRTADRYVKMVRDEIVEAAQRGESECDVDLGDLSVYGFGSGITTVEDRVRKHLRRHGHRDVEVEYRPHVFTPHGDDDQTHFIIRW